MQASRCLGPLVLAAVVARAMRYYRLWIYACNGALLAAAAAFAAAAACILSDARRAFLPPHALQPAHPSLLAAYAALAVQGGVLQVIGCVGAVRLNERLLHAYWLLLAALVLGDAVLGLVWVFRLGRITAELRPALRATLSASYGKDPAFTALWDALQRDEDCCGVISAADFANATAWYQQRHHTSNQPLPSPTPTPSSMSTYAYYANSNNHLTRFVVPLSCCTRQPVVSQQQQPPDDVPSFPPQQMALQMQQRVISSIVNHSASHVITEQQPPQQPPVNQTHSLGAATCPVRSTGCGDRLLRWLRRSADLLLVLGFCVLGFLKLCALAILRYEIKEMVQKIRVLQDGPHQFPELTVALGLNLGTSSPPPTVATTGSSGNPTSVTTVAVREEAEGAAIANLGTSLSSAGGQILMAPATLPSHLMSINDGGTDSDTNSNCALLVETHQDDLPTAAKKPGGKNHNNNDSESHEMRDFRWSSSQPASSSTTENSSLGPLPTLHPHLVAHWLKNT